MRTGLALLFTLLMAAPASAAGWSPPAAFDPAHCKAAEACVIEPAPRVAVNARGAAAATWIDSRDRVRAAAGSPLKATTLGKGGLRPTVTVGPDGTATVVWEDGDTLRFARGRARFGAAKQLARGEFAAAAAQPDGSVVVAYESGDAVEAITISPRGKPGTPVAVGPGGVAHARAAGDGTLAVCCLQNPFRAAVYRSAWRTVAVALPGEYTVESEFADASGFVVGTTQVEQEGDAGIQGLPGLSRAGADDLLGAPLHPAVKHSNRALEPDVTIDGSGRSVLVFQEKSAPRAFERTAPVYASVAGASRQTLDSGEAYQPTVRPLGTGAIAVWQATKARWGIAIERDGRFQSAAAPSGPGPAFRDAHGAYDLATSGNHAVLAWIAADGSVRISQLR